MILQEPHGTKPVKEIYRKALRIVLRLFNLGDFQLLVETMLIQQACRHAFMIL